MTTIAEIAKMSPMIEMHALDSALSVRVEFSLPGNTVAVHPSGHTWPDYDDYPVVLASVTLPTNISANYYGRWADRELKQCLQFDGASFFAQNLDKDWGVEFEKNRNVTLRASKPTIVESVAELREKILLEINKLRALVQQRAERLARRTSTIAAAHVGSPFQPEGGAA